MIGIVLVSHSKKITDGLKELIEEMSGATGNMTVVSNGGTEDGQLGSNPMLVLETLESMTDYETIYLFAGVGSSKMAVETAIDLLDNTDHIVDLSDYPLVESAFAVGISTSAGASKEQVMKELEQL